MRCNSCNTEDWFECKCHEVPNDFKRDLKQYILHVRQKPFKCNLCLEIFELETDLQRHLLHCVIFEGTMRQKISIDRLLGTRGTGARAHPKS